MSPRYISFEIKKVFTKNHKHNGNQYSQGLYNGQDSLDIHVTDTHVGLDLFCLHSFQYVFLEDHPFVT